MSFPAKSGFDNQIGTHEEVVAFQNSDRAVYGGGGDGGGGFIDYKSFGGKGSFRQRTGPADLPIPERWTIGRGDYRGGGAGIGCRPNKRDNGGRRISRWWRWCSCF